MIRKRARDFKLAQLVIVLALVFLTLNFPRLAIGIYEVKRFLFEKCLSLCFLSESRRDLGIKS